MSSAQPRDDDHLSDRVRELWVRLGRIIQADIRGPWKDPSRAPLTRLQNCMRAIRHHGGTLEQTLELAALHPDGFGSMLNADAFIRREWIDDVKQQTNAEKEEASAKRRTAEAIARLYDPWEELPLPAWPPGTLSRGFEETITAMCQRDGLDFGAQAMTLISAASGAAPKDARFAPYGLSGWPVPPVCWLLLVSDSGNRKTALLNNVFKPLRRKHSSLWDDYTQRRERWQALPDDQKKKTTKPVEPHSYYVNDASVEKLQMILAANPRGTMLMKDEIAGLFDFGRYGNGSGSAERTFYLEAFEGNPFPVHRVGRDSMLIKNNSLAIFGGTQPDRIAGIKGLDEDGLLQRFMIITVPPAIVSRPDIKPQGMVAMEEVILRLTEMKGGNYTATTKGAELIRQTECDGTAFGTIPDYGKGFQGFARKLHGTHARIALILHMLDAPNEQTIPDSTIERAGRLTRQYLLPHARNFYAVLPDSNATKLRNVAGWILTKAAGRQRIVASDITSGVAGCRGMSTKDLAQLIDPLITGGWLEPEEPFPGNRSWLVCADLQLAFAERRKAETDRRAELRALIQRIGQ